ncbi:MAG: hypothetical protein IPL27_09455 [Lewinellaceae bacterium]|nr:hypothetical protein [Lewinellaceae bacterium]
MPLQLISYSPEALLEAFKSAVKPLYYPSETDAPIEVLQVPVEEIGEAISTQDIDRLFYDTEGDFSAASIEWAEANRLESNGTQRFFRSFTDVITTFKNNEYYVQESGYRELVPHWRNLRNLIFDNLVQQRWFRVDLAEPDGARADIYLVGRHLQIEEDPDTNETRFTPRDWVLLKTHVIET